MAPGTQCPGCLRRFTHLAKHWAKQSAFNSCRPPDVLITTNYIVEVPVATQRLAPQVPVATLRPRSPIIKNKKRKKGHAVGSDLPICRGDAPDLSQHTTTTSNTNQYLLNNSDMDHNDNHQDDNLSLSNNNQQNAFFDDMECDSDAPVPPGSVFPRGSPDQNRLVHNQVNNPGGITAHKGDDKDADNSTNKGAYNGDDKNGANNGTEKEADNGFDKNCANTSTGTAHTMATTMRRRRTMSTTRRTGRQTRTSLLPMSTPKKMTLRHVPVLVQQRIASIPTMATLL